ncbi:hypothetical protein [Microbacterium amylolyticum]|uniref:Uncharacterized protein YacL n=1 Tax=Microbacterium amylolyticum TaxID=936337 RepID=A0ABS4ZJ31_9MICO|nr:hypothetical protein [Microbacterium amylolyticum]MBP2437305.1 uncharacterized protein YacL [Microbacterium amylolyticum]
MNKGTIWTILGVIVAVVVAFWIVNFLLSAIFILFKLAIVAVVAVVVYFGLRTLFASRN